MLEKWLYFCGLPAAAGFLLDLILGDPRRIPHPVIFMGRMISFFERRLLTGKTEQTAARQFASGCAAAVAVAALSAAFPAAVVFLACCIHPWAGVALSCLLCWQMYAAKGLKTESMKVYRALREGDTEGARYAVSMIVGRDTSVLDEKGIIRAAVETVAENTSDGVLAPMFYMALAGPVGGYFYKSVNTMDSMTGYRNERYEYYGKCAARMDDVLNFLPARISGLLTVAAAALLPAERGTGFRSSSRGALRIFLRDRKKHASPNSAQTESACAGALGIRLAGPAVYFGMLHDKSYIGDGLREPEYEDICRANRLMYAASAGGEALLILTAAAAFFLSGI